MRIAICLLLTLAAALSPVASAADAPKPQGDDAAIESTVLDLYNVISGPAGTRDWEKFKALFTADAKLASYSKGKLNVMTPDGYIERAGAHFAKNGFFERPVETKIDRFKDIAHVSSRYESRHAADDATPFAKGVNHLELVRIGEKWQIYSIVWEQD